MPSKLSIIIVNWNTKDQLLDCLISIKKTSKENFLLDSVIVVDNASSDNSIALVENQNFSFNFKLFKNSENKGFAFACNQGAEIAGDVDYFLFLNPDTRLHTNSLSKPIKLMDENYELGVTGVQLTDSQSNVQRSCARQPMLKHFINDALGLNKINEKLFPGVIMSSWSHNTNKIVPHVIGAFYLIRKRLFKELEGFDEDYFVYLEDLDLSRRVLIKKYKILYCADVQVFHKGGGSSGQVKDLRLFYSLRSSLIYAKKHFSYFSYLIILFTTLFLEPLTRFVYLIGKKDFIKNIGAVKRAYVLLWKWLLKK